MDRLTVSETLRKHFENEFYSAYAKHHLTISINDALTVSEIVESCTFDQLYIMLRRFETDRPFTLHYADNGTLIATYAGMTMGIEPDGSCHT